MAKFKKGISGILAFIMLCSVFVCNTMVTASAAEVQTWDFGAGSKYRGAESSYAQTVQKGTDTETADYDGLGVDATGTDAKFDLSSNTSYAHINTNTKLTIPVTGDSTIEIKLYSENGTQISFNDIDYPFTGKNVSYKYTGEAGIVSAVFTATPQGGEYISLISVTPIVPDLEPGQAIAGELNYTFKNDGIYLNEAKIEGSDTINGQTNIGDYMVVKPAEGATFDSYDNNNHGYVSLSGNTDIIFNSDSAATFKMYRCQFKQGGDGQTNITLTANDATDNIIPAEGYPYTSGNDNEETIFVYKGIEGAKLKLTIPNGGYIHALSVIKEDAVSITANFSDTTANVSFIDTATNIETDAISANGTITLLKGHTYKLKTDNIATKATISGSEEYTVSDASEVTIDVSTIDAVQLSGEITGMPEGTVANDVITSLIFTNLESGEKITVENSDITFNDNKFSLNVLPGEFKMSAVTTNDYVTNNRVSVKDEGTSDEEVYFVKGSFAATYDAPKLESMVTDKSDTMVVLDGFSAHGQGHGPKSSNGTVTVNLPAAGSVKATVSYRGDITISGTTGAQVSAKTETDGTIAECTYKASGPDTVTIKVNSESYLKEIVITPINAIPFVNKITVSDTAAENNYPTVTAALKAISNMENRPEGEAGRVTIDLQKDVKEQVHVDVPYVTLSGNEHTISWYYGMRGAYYSVDSSGYYNEELFHDKYEKQVANSSFWGGVVIVDASDFYAENVTFKNTYNYEIDPMEKEDGAYICKIVDNSPTYDPSEPEVSVGEENVRSYKRYGDTTSIDVNSYLTKERANALALSKNSDRAEFYNVKILSSQDTLGWNGQHTAKAYFKDCTIGGNVDYICGAGDMIFDGCTLETKGYSDDNKTAYITAAKAKQKYLFMNCVITENNFSNYNVDTYYGRAWLSDSDLATDVDVKFINTKTHDNIIIDGWKDWNKPAYDSATGHHFGEYGNLTEDGSEFKSVVKKLGEESTTISPTLTDEEYNNLMASIDTAYLGGWKPQHYTPSIVSTDGGQDAIVGKANGETFLIYSSIDQTSVDKADEIGFVISTKDHLVKEGRLNGEGKVYKEIKTSDTETIPADEGKYLFAFVVKDITTDNLTDVTNLFVKSYQKKGDEVVYGPAKTFTKDELLQSQS